MTNFTPEQQQKREAAHEAAACSNSTLWPNWPNPTPKPKPKKFRGWKTPRFMAARSFKAGYGSLS